MAMINHDIVVDEKPTPPDATGNDRYPGSQRLKPHHPNSVKAFMIVSGIVNRARPPLKIARNEPRRDGVVSRQIFGSSTRARTQRVRNAGKTPTRKTARQPHRGNTIMVTRAADA